MKTRKIRGVVLNHKDNVGVALMDLEPGIELDLKVDGQAISVKLVEPITYQHKFSVKDIYSGGKIIKFGEVIGEATRDIKTGQHVHIHNMVGLRVRLAEKKRR
jgi:altronate dehydratase small subunit